MLNAAPRQQASRPDKAWARRALTDQYATRFVARRSRSALQVRCKTLAGHSAPSASAVDAEVADSEPVLTLARALVGALPKSTTAACDPNARGYPRTTAAGPEPHRRVLLQVACLLASKLPAYWLPGVNVVIPTSLAASAMRRSYVTSP